jgi:hypothetical protein
MEGVTGDILAGLVRNTYRATGGNSTTSLPATVKMSLSCRRVGVLGLEGDKQC